MAESWVRVESESELRAGSYRVTPCKYCKRAHAIILTQRTGRWRCGTCGVCDNGWKSIGSCCPPHPNGACYVRAIREGRLYRMSIDEPAAEETARTRERERTR